MYRSFRLIGTLTRLLLFIFYSASVPQPAELSRSSTPQSFKSAGLDSSYRSPVLSEGSGTFENATQRKKSHPHSDKGYGSTTSVSSGSSGDSK